ncbi:RidA family protein [Sorangium sp. So ce321]|uniref:RidA family protein n=1 Tax=Sorangium sp. So ce321 TaxID=3133300 RepID=UPI003F5F1CED
MINMRTKTSGNRKSVFSPSAWEPKMGYARGVRVGHLVFVAGTVAADGDGRTIGRSITEQTDYVINKIRAALRELGADLHNVVRTDTFLVDFADFDSYAEVHRGYFGDIEPVNTTVQCTRLVNPDHLVEMSAIAILEQQ